MGKDIVRRRVYIAGPMRSIKDFNFPAFHSAAANLRLMGHQVWNPAEHDESIYGVGFAKSQTGDLKDVPQFDLRRALRADLDWISEHATAIAMLPGWEKSKGARTEHALAVALDLDVLLLDDGGNIVKTSSCNTAAAHLNHINAKDAVAAGKLDMTLFPTTALAYGALAMAEGDRKYGGFNWRQGGVQASVYVAALLRHTAQWYNGEWSDGKTRVPHLASMLACVAIIVDSYECGVLKDDRPPQADMTRLIEEFNGILSHLSTLHPDKVARFTEARTAIDAMRCIAPEIDQ